MKKRLFTTLLLLCLLVAALTVMASAAEPAKYVFNDDTYANNGRTITFTFTASYHCPWYGGIDTPVTNISNFRVNGITEWTSDRIVFDIEVKSIYCGGNGGTHNAHTDVVSNGPHFVTFTGSNLCHKAFTSTAKTGAITYNTANYMEFTVTTSQPRYTLTKHPQADPTCTEYGYTQTCYECPGCGKFFADQNAEQGLSDSVRRAMTPHDYVNGVCQVCGATGEAYTLSSSGKTYYTTVEAALAAAYDDPDNLSVWITHYEREADINLTNSCDVRVCNGVTIRNITSASDSQTAINIKITNHGTIKTIAPNSSGTQFWEITNHGRILEKIDIPDNGSLSMKITNNKDAVIDSIQSPRTKETAASVTIQNNGTITELDGKKPFKLLSGTGKYVFITTEKTGSKLCELLDDGCKFYLPSERSWFGSESKWLSTQNSIVSTPPFSVSVTGPNGLQLDESGSYSLTLAAKDVQNQTLTASLSYPDANTSLSSKGAGFNYGWYYAGAAAARWEKAELPLNELAVGVNHLTLRVTDDRYNYTHSINVTVAITSKDAEPISFKAPEGSFTKMYDGTDSVPKNLTIGFVDSKGATVPLTVDTDYTVVTAAYNSANCKEAATITVQAKLTEKAQKTYSLTKDTFTVKGTITKFKPEGNDPFFYFNAIKYDAKVGDRIMDHLPKQKDAKDAFKYWNSSEYQAIPNPLDANPTITYYRMRSENIYDPTTDEKITENSIFAYEGKYYIYAVIGETENYAELLTDCTTLTAKPVLGRHTHCLYGHKDCTAEELLTYTGFSGSSLSPDGSANQRSYYLNAQRSIVNLDLILRKLSGSSSENPSLDLCLYGKTLRADSNYPAQFRVSNKWHLTLTDCIGTGVLKGTNVDDEHGGCLYVADATAEIYNIKVTGGSSSKLGGAIVVDKNGTLNLYSGEISGNHVTSGKGGAIYIKSGGVVNIYGGTIKNNHVYSGNGGAIYVEAGGTLNLYGGTITGNTASTLGGGIYVEKGGTLKIQGNPVVTRNTAGGKDSNVYFCVDSTNPLLTISGELTDGAKLGVSTNAPYPILLAASEQDYSAYFTPDDPDVFVLFSGSALTLCAKPTATLEGDTLTVKTGGKYASDAFILFVAEYGKDGRMLAVQSKTVEPGTADYTFTVKNSGAKLKCFLLRKDTYTPLFEAFTPQ